MKRRYHIGHVFTIAGDEGIECVVTEIGEDGRITKAKAVKKDEKLLKLGFFIEGDDYVIFEFQICEN